MIGAGFGAVLFDLDGTLVHTAPDIAAALNAALCTNGLVVIDPAKIADLVGKGARILVKRALSTQGLDDERLLAAVFDDYVREYAARIGSDGSAFPGAIDCLRLDHAVPGAAPRRSGQRATGRAGGAGRGGAAVVRD